MSFLLLFAVISIAGAVGGVVNAIMTENGFVLPRKEDAGNGTTILRPGYLGNVLIGAVAAGISWGLYGPLSSYVIVGSEEATKQNPIGSLGITLASLVGAVLVGVGGARWLTNEVDKNLLHAAASQAAGRPPSAEASQRIALASPASALDIARKMQ